MHELVGDAVDGDRQEAGVAEDDFIVAFGGRVALVSGPHVLGQGAPEAGQLPHEADGVLLAAGFTVAAGQAVAQALMADGQGDLPGEDLEKAHGLLTEIVAQVDAVHPFADEIAGVKEAAGPVEDIDDFVPGGDGLGAHVIEAVLPPAGAHQLIDDLRDGLPKLLDGLGFDLAAVFGFFVHATCHPPHPNPLPPQAGERGLKAHRLEACATKITFPFNP